MSSTFLAVIQQSIPAECSTSQLQTFGSVSDTGAMGMQYSLVRREHSITRTNSSTSWWRVQKIPASRPTTATRLLTLSATTNHRPSFDKLGHGTYMALNTGEMGMQYSLVRREHSITKWMRSTSSTSWWKGTVLITASRPTTATRLLTLSATTSGPSTSRGYPRFMSLVSHGPRSW